MKNLQNPYALKTISQQRGASLLEGIAYLGIAAIVILGAVSLLSGAFGSAQSNRGAEEVVSIRTGVKKLYMGRAGSYIGDMTGTLISAKVFPSTLTANSGATAMVNTWGGNVNVAGLASDASRFTITYTAVPKDACISMASGATGWTKISVGSGSITTFPVATSEANTVCTSDAANTMAFESN